MEACRHDWIRILNETNKPVNETKRRVRKKGDAINEILQNKRKKGQKQAPPRMLQPSSRKSVRAVRAAQKKAMRER